MSRLNVENIRHPDAASDSLQLSDTGNVTAPGNLSVTGTSTLTGNTVVTGSLTANGLAYPSAGPLSNRNLFVNGEARVAQRGNSRTGITTGGADNQAVDLFRPSITSLGTWTLSKETDAPVGFANSFKVDCTTADAAPSGGDLIAIDCFLEAQNLQVLGYGSADAVAATLSFYVKSNKTGSGTVTILQSDNSNKCINVSYSISSADTWERKTISLPADTSGVINSDNGRGMAIEFWLNSGSSFTGGSEQTTWTTLVSDNRNFANLGIGGSTDDYWQITGVQLEVGSVATPFEHRSYGDELARCQRYYQHFATDTSNAVYLGMGISASSTQARMFMPISVAMRTTPSITANGASADDQQAATYSLSSPSVVGSTASTVRVDFSTSGMTTGRPIQLQVGTGESITLSAEL